MIGYLAEGLEFAFELTNDERARDMMLGLTEYVLHEGLVNECYSVMYRTPIDYSLVQSSKEAALGSERAICGYGHSFRGWRFLSLLALAYKYTGSSSYLDLFNSINRERVIKTGHAHVWYDYMDFMVEGGKNDDVPPDTITNLLAEYLTGGKIKLSWSAPVDAHYYQIKYSDKPIVEHLDFLTQRDSHSNWWAAENYTDEPIPQPPGTEESMIIEDVKPGNYYFAIRSYDDNGNRSEISNLEEVNVPSTVVSRPSDLRIIE